MFPEGVAFPRLAAGRQVPADQRKIDRAQQLAVPFATDILIYQRREPCQVRMARQQAVQERRAAAPGSEDHNRTVDVHFTTTDAAGARYVAIAVCSIFVEDDAMLTLC